MRPCMASRAAGGLCDRFGPLLCKRTLTTRKAKPTVGGKRQRDTEQRKVANANTEHWIADKLGSGGAGAQRTGLAMMKSFRIMNSPEHAQTALAQPGSRGNPGAVTVSMGLTWAMPIRGTHAQPLLPLFRDMIEDEIAFIVLDTTQGRQHPPCHMSPGTDEP